MVTIPEIEAKMAKAAAAGDSEAVKLFQERLSILKASPGDIMAKMERAKAAGDTEAVSILGNALKIRNDWQAEQYAAPEGSPDAPPRATEGGQSVYQDGRVERATADTIAKFEAQNPALKGKFKPGDSLPAVGSPSGVMQGTAKSGGRNLPVSEWRQGKVDTFGDTAGAMMEGPIAGMKMFAGGLTGSNPSPSREFLANDPLTRGLPGPVLTGLGMIGDTGMTGLAALGVGMAGAAGLASEMVPGQGPAAERKFAEDTLQMSQFAVPELAGASSVGAKMATAAPKVVPAVSATEKAVAGAEGFGIPVMRTDVKPPQTFIGKVIQKIGEAIPIAGTGGMRANQEAARLAAVKSFVQEYASPDAIDEVAAAVMKKSADEVVKLTKRKTEVIDRISGAVDTPQTNAAIDAQIAKIARGTKEVADQVIPILKQWKQDIVGKTLAEIELIRKQVGERFTALDASAGRKTGEAAVSSIYGPLRADMGEFIKKNGKPGDFIKWKSANDKLADNIGEAQTTALKSLLRDGEKTPELVARLLFSQKPSELQRLKGVMPPSAAANARAAIVQEALKKATNDAAGIEGISVSKFKTALEKLWPQARVFMDKPDLEAAEGLVKALELTKRAGQAGVSTNTGAQVLPVALAGFLTSTFGIGGAFGGGIALGAFARLYEATGVRSALRALARQNNPATESLMLKKLEAALENSGVIGANAAAQNMNQPPQNLRSVSN